ncbi:MAG TPA: 4Fe-4S ferredoxin [Spirochaetia bacterium]|nr:MAG: 4Fe-4S ferredoxin [Spirochaetes bacterium GWB1_36_13]HCL55505.1 4Fe-4S ferredoxin [Spirochaetia bacterium]
MKRQNLRKGILILSFLLLPITQFYFSPFLIMMGLSENLVNGSFIVFAALFSGAMFFGRAFCGWIMPCGGIQEICFAVKDKKVSQRTNWIKWVIWFPWIILMIVTAIRAGGIFRIHFFYQVENGISISFPWQYIIYYTVIFLFLLLSLTVGKRASCHVACWMSPFMILGKKVSRLIHLPSLRLKADSKNCISCRQCEKSCPMSLNVPEMVKSGKINHNECILCGACADICPKKVISFSFGTKN